MENAAHSSTATMRDATVRDDSRLRQLRARLWRSVSPRCLAGRSQASRSFAGRSFAGRSLAGALAVAVLSLGDIPASRAEGASAVPISFIDPWAVRWQNVVNFQNLQPSTGYGAVNHDGVVFSPALNISGCPAPCVDPITFSNLNTAPLPSGGHSYADYAVPYSDPTIGLNFAEKFLGQTVYPNPIAPLYDALSGAPGGPLTLDPSAPGFNVASSADSLPAIFARDPSFAAEFGQTRFVSGLGTLGFGAGSGNTAAIGEGAIAFLLPPDNTSIVTRDLSLVQFGLTGTLGSFQDLTITFGAGLDNFI